MSRPEWLTPLDTKQNPCLCCPPIYAEAPPDKLIAVGFGSADVTCDGRVVYVEPVNDDDSGEGDFWDFARAETEAAKDPDHDWRASLFGPLHGETYQRQDGKWLLVETNQGFA